jgi:hypothetical protein
MDVVFACDRCGIKLLVDYDPTCREAACPTCERIVPLPSSLNAATASSKAGTIRLQTLGVTYMAELDEHRFSKESERHELLHKIDMQFRSKYGHLLRGGGKGIVNKETTLVSLQYTTKYAKPELMRVMGSFLDDAFRPYKKAT